MRETGRGWSGSASAEVALADAQQQVLEANNRLQIARAAYNRAVGRDLAAPVELAELYDDGQGFECESLTAIAIERRPELMALAAQSRALVQQAASERAFPASELASRAAAAGFEGELSASVTEAVARARALAAPTDTIFVGGSTFVVAEVL